MTKFENLSFKIAEDLNIAQEVLKDLSKPKILTIFGSARIKEDSPIFTQTKNLAKKFSDGGYNICTGGGPGLMLAGSQGGKEGASSTLGLSIVLPHEQKPNQYLDRNITFRNFSQRKIVFATVSNAYVIVPGGYGTLDELFEIATLIQCKVIPYAPIVLFNKKYWKPLMNFIKTSLLEEKTIKQEDIDLFYLSDDIDETYSYIESKIVID
jgi:uncharacterized protein (TIGR00730 family)